MEHIRVVLREPVARLIELRRVPVHECVPAGYQLLRALGEEVQRFAYIALLAAAEKFFSDSLGAGVVPLAGVAAQYKRFHF